MHNALRNLPINLDAWIEKNKDALKPPIGNRQFWKGDWQNLMVMMVGGPTLSDETSIAGEDAWGRPARLRRRHSSTIIGRPPVRMRRLILNEPPVEQSRIRLRPHPVTLVKRRERALQSF